MCGFLYVVSNNHNHKSILHSYADNEPQRYCGSDLDNLGHVTLPDMWPFDGYRDMKPDRYPGHVLDLLWSRDVIGHVTIRLPMGCFL